MANNVAPDLRVQPARRWSATVDGIAWLPRMIDKARAERAGTLGSYLWGQSPIDRAALRVLDMTFAEFTALVADAPSDDDVVAALRARSPERLAALTAWSRTLGANRRLHLAFLDIDDGYTHSPLMDALRGPYEALLRAIVPLARRAMPPP